MRGEGQFLLVWTCPAYCRISILPRPHFLNPASSSSRLSNNKNLVHRLPDHPLGGSTSLIRNHYTLSLRRNKYLKREKVRLRPSAVLILLFSPHQPQTVEIFCGYNILQSAWDSLQITPIFLSKQLKSVLGPIKPTKRISAQLTWVALNQELVLSSSCLWLGWVVFPLLVLVLGWGFTSYLLSIIKSAPCFPSLCPLDGQWERGKKLRPTPPRVEEFSRQSCVWSSPVIQHGDCRYSFGWSTVVENEMVKA